MSVVRHQSDRTVTGLAAGSIVVTYAGASHRTSARREVISYDRLHTARIKIMQDGTTKRCTLPFPRGRITCS